MEFWSAAAGRHQALAGALLMAFVLSGLTSGDVQGCKEAQVCLNNGLSPFFFSDLAFLSHLWLFGGVGHSVGWSAGFGGGRVVVFVLMHLWLDMLVLNPLLWRAALPTTAIIFGQSCFKGSGRNLLHHFYSSDGCVDAASSIGVGKDGVTGILDVLVRKQNHLGPVALTLGHMLHRHHPNASMIKGCCVLGVSSSVTFTCSSNHVEFAVRVEHRPPVRPWSIGLLLVLLRFDGEIHGNYLWSPVKLIKNLRLDNKPRIVPFIPWRQPKGSPACQAVCTLVEACRWNRRGNAAAPCRFRLLLLHGCIQRNPSLAQFSLPPIWMVLCILKLYPSRRCNGKFLFP